MNIPFRRSKKGITLKVKVEPRSSRKGISGVVGDSVKVKVHAPPVKGEANTEIIEILSKEFNVKKNAIRIITGHYSRDKVVEIAGIKEIN